MALIATPGESRTFGVYGLTDETGAPLTAGAVVTIAITDAFQVAVVAPVATTLTIDTDGNANYLTDTPLTVPTTPGNYYVKSTVVYDGLTTLEYEALTVIVGTAVAGMTTLLELVRQVAGRLGDYHQAIATEAGTTTQFIDHRRLRKQDHFYKSRQAYIAESTYAAANVGLTFRVQDSDFASTSLTLQPAADAAFAAGDVLDLHNVDGTGWDREDVVRAINGAIRAAAQGSGVALVQTIATPYDADTITFTPDATVQAVAQVEYLDVSGEWQIIPTSSWRVHAAEGTVQLDGSARWDANGRTLRIRGFGRHPELTGDTDSTLCGPYYVEVKACYDLLVAGNKRDLNRQGLIPLFQREVADWGAAATAIPPPGTRVLRGV